MEPFGHHGCSRKRKKKKKKTGNMKAGQLEKESCQDVISSRFINDFMRGPSGRYLEGEKEKLLTSPIGWIRKSLQSSVVRAHGTRTSPDPIQGSVRETGLLSLPIAELRRYCLSSKSISSHRLDDLISTQTG